VKEKRRHSIILAIWEGGGEGSINHVNAFEVASTVLPLLNIQMTVNYLEKYTELCMKILKVELNNMS
jgi:hypothetical protein